MFSKRLQKDEQRQLYLKRQGAFKPMKTFLHLSGPSARVQKGHSHAAFCRTPTTSPPPTEDPSCTSGWAAVSEAGCRVPCPPIILDRNRSPQPCLLLVLQARPPQSWAKGQVLMWVLVCVFPDLCTPHLGRTPATTGQLGGGATQAAGTSNYSHFRIKPSILSKASQIHMLR